MADRLTTALLNIERSICGGHGPLLPDGTHGLLGPVLGNLLVIAVSATISLVCIVLAFRMVIRPGESNPDHPKRRILSADR